MSDELEHARELVAAGSDKKALKRLWTVESTARSSKQEAQALLDLVSQIHARSSGRAHRDAQMLLDIARAHVSRFSSDPTADAIIKVPRCRVLASEGFKPNPDEIWELTFTGEAVFLRSLNRGVNELERIEYADLRNVAVGEPPSYRVASKATVAGLKVAGAMFGFLASSISPVGGVPSTPSNDIGITLRTSSGALVLLHVSELTLDQWRARLAPAATKVRPRRSVARRS